MGINGHEVENLTISIKNIFVGVAVGIVLFFIVAESLHRMTNTEYPLHKIVDNSSLYPKDGNRVQIDSVSSNITKEECISLIKKYRRMAGKEGHISVHKQDVDSQMLPWCHEDIGEGKIKFNDYFFE